MAESKATKIAKFEGSKEFEIIKDSKYVKKGDKLRLTYELYLNLKDKKLVK